MCELLNLATEEFDSLSTAEVSFIRSVAKGQSSDFCTRIDDEDNPANSDHWGVERTIKSNLITWLCANKNAIKLVTKNGIQISGALIEGIVSLSFINISFPLQFQSCSFPALINLSHSEIKLLNLIGSHTVRIEATGMKVNGDINLSEGFSANGEVSLSGATVSGKLNCDGAQIINIGGSTLNAENIKISGNLLLRNGFKSAGEIRLINASIKGQLNCIGCEIENGNKISLFADNISVRGSVLLRQRFSANGEVRFFGANIGGNFELDGAHITNIGGSTFNAENIKVSGSLFLRNGFKSEGEVRLINASIDGSLECDGGSFINKSGISIFADTIEVRGDIYFRSGFYSEGTIKIIGANIGGSFECDGAVLKNLGKNALEADRIRVGGNILLRNGFQVKGKIVMLGSKINGNFECDDASFENDGNEVLLLDSIFVGRNIFFRKCFYHFGKINLIGATIKGHLAWQQVNNKSQGELDLRSATIKSLIIDFDCLPKKGSLYLQNLIYEDIMEIEDIDSKQFIELLHRQSSDFLPQPYEQMAKILRKSGKEEASKQILIQKNIDQYNFSNFKIRKFLRFYFLKILIGFGYRRWQPLWTLLFFVLLGTYIFNVGYNKHIFIPSPDKINISIELDSTGTIQELYLEFYPLVFSLDNFIPFIDLRHADYWLLNTIKGEGIISTLVVFYFYCHIILGWVLTTLFIVGLTGIIRQ